FLGRTPWRAARARRALGVSRSGAPGPGSPADLDARDALPEGGERRERRGTEVDDPPRDVRPTIVDCDSDRMPVVEVRHGHLGSEGERPMGRVEAVAAPVPVVPGSVAEPHAGPRVRRPGPLLLDLVH